MVTRQQFNNIIEIFTNIKNLTTEDISNTILLYNQPVKNLHISSDIITMNNDNEIIHFFCDDGIIYQDRIISRKRFSYQYEEFLWFIKNNFTVKQSKIIDITHLVK